MSGLHVYNDAIFPSIAYSRNENVKIQSAKTVLRVETRCTKKRVMEILIKKECRYGHKKILWKRLNWVRDWVPTIQLILNVDFNEISESSMINVIELSGLDRGKVRGRRYRRSIASWFILRFFFFEFNLNDFCAYK